MEKTIKEMQLLKVHVDTTVLFMWTGNYKITVKALFLMNVELRKSEIKCIKMKVVVLGISRRQLS